MKFNWDTFTYDEDWLREAARIEEEADCDISAGYDWGTHTGDFLANPEGHNQLMHMRSLVKQAWRQLVFDWKLGIGTDAAINQGEKLLMARLQQPPKEIQATLLALLKAKLSQPQGEWEMTEAVHAEIRGVFGQVLTQEDWQAIATSARDSIYKQVLEQPLVTVKGPDS
ncbi:MAG: hypothetical protein AAGE59_36720 [Cyanobacteria bacterium P01_F01_bin.86]